MQKLLLQSINQMLGIIDVLLFLDTDLQYMTVHTCDGRNHEYYNNGQLISTSNEDVAAKTGTNTGNLDMPSASQPEVIRNDTLDATHGLQYNFPSASGYALSSTSQPNEAAYTYPQGNTQMQNLSPFSNLMVNHYSALCFLVKTKKASVYCVLLL